MRFGDRVYKHFFNDGALTPAAATARFTAAGLSFDTYLPTGDPDTGHGSGSTLIAPGVTFGFRAAEWLDLFPMISYQHSFGEGRLPWWSLAAR